MTLHLELEPAVEAKLSAMATANGVDLAAYAKQVVVEAALQAQPNKPKDVKAFSDWIDQLGRITRGRDFPRDETFSREMIYSDERPVPGLSD